MKTRPQPVTASTPTASGNERSRVLSHAVSEACRRLKLRSSELHRVIGTSQPTASRLLNGKWQLPAEGKPFELAAHLVRLYRSLAALVGGDDGLARDWLNSANDDFAGRDPRSVIQTVEGLIHVCDYLDAQRARV